MNLSASRQGVELTSRLALLVTPVIAFFGAACVTSSSSLGPSEMRAPKSDPGAIGLAEVQALRVPPPAELPAALRDAARLYEEDPARLDPLERVRLVTVLGAPPTELAALWQAAEAGPLAQRIDARLHRCLVEESLRRYPEMIAACASFLDAAPTDPRAVPVVWMLARVRAATEGVDDVLLERAPTWGAACRQGRPRDGSCAPLHFALADVVARIRMDRGDEEGARAAVRAQGRLRGAEVSGPYLGVDAFRVGFEQEPFVLEPDAQRAVSQRQEPWDGRFAPALRGVPGLYELRSEALSPRAQRVTLVVRASHALRVEVDDVIVLERRPELREEPALTSVSLRLSAGVHRIRMLAESYGWGDNLQVSFLDDAGAPALEELASAHHPHPAGRLEGRPQTRVVERALRARERVQGLAGLDAALLRLHLGRAAFDRSAADQRDDVRQLLRTWGFAPTALVFAADAVGDDRSVPSRLAAADAAPLWEALARSWPDHPVAMLVKARALREERPEESLAAYRDLAARFPAYPFGLREYAGLALERGLLDEAMRAAELLQGQERSPANLEVILPVWRRSGRWLEAAALEAERARRSWPLFDDTRARWLLQAGRTEEAIAELERICGAEAGHPAEELLWGLLTLRDPRRALARVDAVVAAFPNDRSARIHQVRLRALLEGPNAARALAEEALSRLGADRDLHEFLEEAGAKPLWHERLKEGDHVLAFARQSPDVREQGHPVYYWLDRFERHLMSDLSSIEVRHFIAQLDSEEALDRFGEMHVGTDERVLRIRVQKPDGRILEPEHPPGISDISLTGLAVGDLVEWLVVAFEGPPRTGGLAFETFRMTHAVPALRREYVLSLPERLENDPRFSLYRQGDALALERRVDAGRVFLHLRHERAPARLEEPHAPASEDNADLAGYGWQVDDEHWALWRGQGLERNARVEPWLREAAERIAGRGSEAERFERIFRFVAAAIASEEGASSALATLATGRGDRTALLLALSRAARLPVRAIAVHAPMAGSLRIPGPAAFATRGVRLQALGAERLAFVEEDLITIEGLPPLARGGQMLDLTLGATLKRRRSAIPDAQIARDVLRVRADLAWQGSGRLGGWLALRVPSHQAEGVRRGLRRASEAQLVALFEHALGESLPGVKVSEWIAPDLDAAGTPLSIGMQIDVPLPTGGEAIGLDRLFGQGLTARLGLSPAVTSYLRVADRQSPLQVSATAEEMEATLTLPAGSAFLHTPDPLDLRAGPFRLWQQAEVRDGRLLWRRRIEAENARVPAAAWGQLRTSLTDLSHRTEGRLRFQLPPAQREAALP